MMMDRFNEINNEMYVAMTELKRLKDKSNNICKNKTIIQLQNEIKAENAKANDGIKLVAIDISRTIVEYISNETLKKNAANKIRKKYSILKKYSENDLIELIENGFNEYSNNRKKTNKEVDELTVYKNYIFTDLNDETIIDIINIWRENSVNIKLNCQNIFKIVSELKKCGCIVITISDMLGEMSHYSLKKLDLYEIFDAHFCSNDFKYRKSNTEHSLYKIVAEHYKMKPYNCLMIGNDYNDDIMSPIKNGWKAVYIKYNNDSVNNENILLEINKLDDIFNVLVSNPDKLKLYSKNMTKYYNFISNRQNDFDKYISISYYLRQHTKTISNRSLREKIYKEYLLNKCGDNVRLGNNLEVRNPYNIYIGKNCQINDNVTILNGEAPVLIGNNVMIAINTFISTYSHNWKKGMIQDNLKSWQKGNTRNSLVSIESNCWLGPNCVLEAGTFIGHHSVVCANTLVKAGEYPPYSLIGGNPGVIIRNIKTEIDIERKIFNYE